MISTSFDSILKAVLFFSCFGVGVGCIYALLIRVTLFLKTVFLRKPLIKSEEIANRGFFWNLFDFLFTLTVAVVCIISYYVILDGVFELYSIILFVTFYTLSKRLFLRLFGLNRVKYG